MFNKPKEPENYFFRCHFMLVSYTWNSNQKRSVNEKNKCPKRNCNKNKKKRKKRYLLLIVWLPQHFQPMCCCLCCFYEFQQIINFQKISIQRKFRAWTENFILLFPSGVSWHKRATHAKFAIKWLTCTRIRCFNNEASCGINLAWINSRLDEEAALLKQICDTCAAICPLQKTLTMSLNGSGCICDWLFF